MLKFDVYFEILKLSTTFYFDMVSYTPQFKHKNNQITSTDCAERCWMLYVPM